MPSIAILDQDRSYADALKHQFHILLPTYQLYVWTPDQMERALAEGKHPDYLIRSQGLRLSSRLERALFTCPTVTRILNRPIRKPSEFQIGESCRQIWKRLQSEADVLKSRAPVLVCMSPSPRERQQFIAMYLKRAAEAGLKLFYLPLVPAYELELPLNFHPGPCLADWFLQVQNGLHPDPSALGPRFERQNLGIYCIRMGDPGLNPISLPDRIIRLLLSDWIEFLFKDKHAYGLLELPAMPAKRLLPCADLGEAFLYWPAKQKGLGGQVAEAALRAVLPRLQIATPVRMDQGLPPAFDPTEIVRRPERLRNFESA